MKYPNVKVKTVMEKLISTLISTFPSEFRSIFVHGSIATGAYNIETSDIDYIVVFDHELTEETYDKLLTLHKSLNHELTNKLEGSYISYEMFKQDTCPEEDRIYLNDNKLLWAAYGDEWYFERAILKSHGILLHGEDYRFEIEPINLTYLLEAADNLYLKNWSPLTLQADELSDDYLIYGIKTLCRMIFLKEKSALASKDEAVEFVSYRFMDWDTEFFRKSSYNHVVLVEMFLEIMDLYKKSYDFKGK